MKADRVKLLLAVSIALTILSSIITFYAIRESYARVAWVFHTYNVISQSNDVLSMLKDAETDTRGYILTADSSYLSQKQEADKLLPETIDSLKLLVADNTTQQKYLSQTILPLIHAKQDVIEKTLELLRSKGPLAAQEFIKTNEGKIIMDSLRLHMVHFKRTEITLLNSRLKEMSNTLERQNLMRYISFFLIALVSFVALLVVDKQQKQNTKLISQLKEANETLDQKVRDRTRELARQNENVLELNEELRQNMEEMESFYEALQSRSIRTEDTLKEIRDLYDNAPCGYHSLSPDGTILRINDRELTWLGYTREEVVGKMNVTQILSHDEHQSYFDDFEKFKVEGFIKNKEHTFIRKDGSSLSILLNSTAIYDEKGDYYMSRGTVIDISERKASEEKLIEANRSLLRLDEEKNHFLGIAAHDMKSPLHSILGLINLINLKGDNLKPEQQQYLKYIQKSCINMQTLIVNLLDINKIEQGITVINPEKVQLKVLSEGLMNVFHEQAKAKNIALRLESNAADKTIVTDGHALERILQNLLSNAIKFSPRDKEVLLRVVHNHATIKFEIIDQGQGISKEEVPMLFKKFQRLTARPTDGESSTGLGLSIVKELVHAMHGSVSVESEVNRGSTFTIELPVS